MRRGGDRLRPTGQYNRFASLGVVSQSLECASLCDDSETMESVVERQAAADARDWRVFVESRLSQPPPVSPLDFLQEYYAADSWRLLV